MTIDLKYLIPFALPFAILAALRGLVFCAGVEWSTDMFGVMVISVFGWVGGILVIMILNDSGITWPLHIGRRNP